MGEFCDLKRIHQLFLSVRSGFDQNNIRLNVDELAGERFKIRGASNAIALAPPVRLARGESRLVANRVRPVALDSASPWSVELLPRPDSGIATDASPLPPHSVTNHVADDPEGILDSICSAMSTIANNNAVSSGHCAVVIGPERIGAGLHAPVK